MVHLFLRPLALSALLGLAAANAASAQDCSGTISADEAMKAENARYAAQTTNDFAAMDKLFGNDLTYNHSSAASDDGPREVPQDDAERRSQDAHLRLSGDHHRNRGLRSDLGGAGSHRTAALHRHLGQAALGPRVRLLAVDGHPGDPVGADVCTRVGRVCRQGARR